MSKCTGSGEVVGLPKGEGLVREGYCGGCCRTLTLHYVKQGEGYVFYIPEHVYNPINKKVA